MRKESTRKIVANGEEIHVFSSPMPFSEFKEWLLVPETEFHNITVSHKPPSTKTTCLGDILFQTGCVVNHEVMLLMLEAYKELLAEKKSIEKKLSANNVDKENLLKRKKLIEQFNFKNFSVNGQEENGIGYLTEKQFQDLIKFGVSQFRNIEILAHPFYFNSLALHCGKRVDVVDGILKIPNNTELTETEWAMLQSKSQSISFSLGKNITVSRAKKSEPHPGLMENYAVEYGYKTQSINDFKNRTIAGKVDLSTGLKTKCPAFNIEGTTFKGSLNVCNAVFAESQVKGANLNGGIIFNDKTDFSKWSGNVNIPDKAPIVYFNKEGVKIETTVKNLYDKLKNEYNKLHGELFLSKRRKNFIATLEAQNKPDSEKLFKLLQHMQEQKKNWFFHRTLDAFNATIDYLIKNQPNTSTVHKQSNEDNEPEGSPTETNSEAETRNNANEQLEELKKKLFIDFNSIPEKIKKGEFVFADNILKECKEIWPEVELNSHIKKAILALKKEAYEEACDSKKVEDAFYRRLSTFIQSDLAKNPLVADFIKQNDLLAFTKALPFSISAKKSLALVEKNKDNLHFGALANLFITIEEAERDGTMHFYDISDKKENGNKRTEIKGIKNTLSNYLFAGHNETIAGIVNRIIMHEKFAPVRENGRLIAGITQDQLSEKMKQNVFGTTFSSSDPGYVKYCFTFQLQKDLDNLLKCTDPIKIAEQLSFMLATLKLNLDTMKKGKNDYGDLLPLFEAAYFAINNANEIYQANFKKFLEALAKQRSTQTATKHVTVIAPDEEKPRAKVIVANPEQQQKLDDGIESLFKKPKQTGKQTSPQSVALSYSEVKALLKDTVWIELEKITSSIATFSIENEEKRNWQFSIDEKNSTSVECAHLRKIVDAMNKTITECDNFASTDESRLTALKNLAETFKKVNKPSLMTLEGRFYNSVEAALALINKKISETEKKLQASKTNPHGLFSHPNSNDNKPSAVANHSATHGPK